MARRRKPKQATHEQQQPYDNVLKLLLEHQEGAILPHFLDEITFLEVLDLEVLKSPLRVDRVYKIMYGGEEHILHLEFEVSGGKKMASRLLAYNAHFVDKFELPVISIIVYPFETTMAESPFQVKSRKKDLITFHFRVMPLWKLRARDYLDAHAVSMYGLLPTMRGADLATLTQAIEELRVYYKGDDIRLRRELLCFRVLLQRAETVEWEDKQQIEERLKMFNDLFEDDPFIQQKKAEGRAEGIAEGEARGQAKGLQTAVVIIIEDRFPSLVPLAEQKVKQLNKPDILKLLLKQVATVDDENTARWLLNTFAA